MTERLLSAISDCLDWAKHTEPPPVLNVEALVLLLSAHADSGAHEPGDWAVEDVHEVAALLRGRPEPPEDVRDTWLSWCDHLVSTGGLRSSESPRRLRACIERVDLGPGLPADLAPEPLPGAAARLLDRLGYGSVDEPEPLLPYTPAPLGELDARARACRVLHRAARLAAWVAPHRLLRTGTDHDELCEQDTARSAQALDTTPGEVRFLFTVARSAALLRTTYLHVLPGPAAHAWAGRRPGAAADAWSDALTTMAALPGPAPFLLLTELFLTGRAQTPAELIRACGTGAVPGEEEPEQHARRVLKALDGLGAVSHLGNDRYRVSALGDYYVARHLRESGIEVPVAPPVSDLDAAPFLALLEEVRPVDVEVLLDRWLAGRAPETAARALAQAGLAPAEGDVEAFVRTVKEHPGAALLLTRLAKGPLKDAAYLAR